MVIRVWLVSFVSLTNAKKLVNEDTRFNPNFRVCFICSVGSVFCSFCWLQKFHSEFLLCYDFLLLNNHEHSVVPLLASIMDDDRWVVEDAPSQVGSMNRDMTWTGQVANHQAGMEQLPFTQWKTKRTYIFIDIRWIAQFYCIRMNILNYRPNVPHLSDPSSSSLLSTMCRFLALYTKARFYLLRRLSAEVNMDWIKLLINMEKCFVPENLHQPPQQHHWKHLKNWTHFWFK